MKYKKEGEPSLRLQWSVWDLQEDKAQAAIAFLPSLRSPQVRFQGNSCRASEAAPAQQDFAVRNRNRGGSACVAEVLKNLLV